MFILARRQLLTVAALAIWVAGCDSRVPTYPVKGQVVFKDDGKPFTGATVIWFESKSPPYTRSAGVLDGQGNFVLSTDRDGNGAMEGPHRVRISSETVEGQSLITQLSKVIDPRFFEYGTSGVEVDIKPDAENVLKIEVEKSKGG